MEKYKDGYVFYSLGNFVFDQMWSVETRNGLIARIFFEGRQFKTSAEEVIQQTNGPIYRHLRVIDGITQ